MAATKTAAAKTAAAKTAAADVAKYVAALDAMTASDRKSPEAVRAMIIEAGFIPCGTGAKTVLRCIPGLDADYAKLGQLIAKQLLSAGYQLNGPESGYVFAMLRTATDSSVHWKVHHCNAVGIPTDGGVAPRGCLTHNGSFPEFTDALESLKQLSSCKTPIPVPRCGLGGSQAGSGSVEPQSGIVELPA